MAMDKTYRFSFEITDDETGECIQTDWTLFFPENVDPFGGCETVDIHVGSALRGLVRDLEHARLRALTKALIEAD